MKIKIYSIFSFIILMITSYCLILPYAEATDYALHDNTNDVLVFYPTYYTTSSSYNFIDIDTFEYSVIGDDTDIVITTEGDIDTSYIFIMYIVEYEEVDNEFGFTFSDFYVFLSSYDIENVTVLWYIDSTPFMKHADILGKTISFSINISLEGDIGLVSYYLPSMSPSFYAVDFVPDEMFVEDDGDSDDDSSGDAVAGLSDFPNWLQWVIWIIVIGSIGFAVFIIIMYFYKKKKSVSEIHI